jgi:hypothetical protein
VGALRAQAREVYGLVPWDPVTGAGNPFLAPVIDTFVQGAQMMLLERGIVPQPAIEALPQEVASIVAALQRLRDGLAPGEGARVQAQQLIAAVLMCFLWGDRIGDVVNRDFSEMVALETLEEVEAALAGGDDAVPEGLTAEDVPHLAGLVRVTYELDKGASLSRDPTLVRRKQLYPLLEDSPACPFAAAEDLAYEQSLLQCKMAWEALSKGGRLKGGAKACRRPCEGLFLLKHGQGWEPRALLRAPRSVTQGSKRAGLAEGC